VASQRKTSFAIGVNYDLQIVYPLNANPMINHFNVLINCVIKIEM